MPRIKFGWAHSDYRSPKGGGRYSCAGFTLIESVTAVSVFAMAITSIMGIYLSLQRLNQASASLQALQQNARFITEDLSKIVRNGSIDYTSYGGSVPQPSTGDLYLLDQDGISIHIYRDSPTETLKIEKQSNTADYTSKEVKIVAFKVYVWPSANPFPGGSHQPIVTILLDLESRVNPKDKTRAKFQFSLATRQYPE